ncbi:MAG: flagellar basal body P-ring protein FlgI, partial [Thermoleophilia bacterium]|nr:flagellar basal body P-ring protein FlgI [Thermoleophilia bacterium]
MRRMDPRRFRVVTALAIVCALAFTAGAGTPKKKRQENPPKVEESIADLAYIASASDLKLEGVGLVVGLDNTGVDPPPSWYRQKLVDDMRKAGIERANDWLKDPRVSMVVVRMTVPAGASTRDRLDVQVELPPASGTKSLAGGYLLQCRLREVMVLGGVPKEGADAAFAQGPVMIGNAANAEDPKVGRVLGGGRIRKEVPFQLILKENRKSFR